MHQVWKVLNGYGYGYREKSKIRLGVSPEVNKTGFNEAIAWDRQILLRYIRIDKRLNNLNPLWSRSKSVQICRLQP